MVQKLQQKACPTVTPFETCKRESSGLKEQTVIWETKISILHALDLILVQFDIWTKIWLLLCCKQYCMYYGQQEVADTANLR